MRSHKNKLLQMIAVVGAVLLILKSVDTNTNATDKIEDKKIIVAVTENSNYVYHMLSVAKCGYDNA